MFAEPGAPTLRVIPGRDEPPSRVASMTRTPRSEDVFSIERHGELTVIVPSHAVDLLDPMLSSQAAELALATLRDDPHPLVVIDLDRVEDFGSIFLSLLLRCWKLVSVKGGLMVLSGVTPRARELLHVTSLDMLWPLYDTRREAMEALLAD